MARKYRALLVLLWIIMTASLCVAATAQDNSKKVIIVSLARPRDSLGETVYEIQGSDQKDQSVIPGVLVEPVPLKLPEPKYPKSLKKRREAADVAVQGIVAQHGRFIDAHISDPVAADVEQCALDAVARYKFKPATLDGKPVAILLRIVIQFHIW